VRFIANYTERAGGADQSYYAEEVWTLSRSADLASRPPARARVIDCPNCGAALDKIVGNECKYCNTITSAGSHDWRVDAVRIEAREPRPPMLTGTTEEQGTDLPTAMSPDVKQRFAALVARDPALTWLGFTKRVTKVFDQFYRSWNEQDLTGVRPFLSDNLFDAQRYWIATYKAAGLKNVAADAEIAGIHISRVTADKHYDSVTERVYASCFDYTVDPIGTVVGGSKSRRRQYSEYWTFIRGTAHTGTPKSEDGCPNCGAAADQVNMAGSCSSCGVEITRDAFDWVLSRIEQDEVYVA
jgi:hypothetical protein